MNNKERNPSNAESLDRLIETIQKDASREIAGIKKTADEEIKKLSVEFEEKKRKWTKLEEYKFEQKGKSEKIKIIAEARIKMKNVLLIKKREIVDDILDETARRLLQSNNNRMIEYLLSITVQSGDEEIIPDTKNKVFDGEFIKNINKKQGWRLTLGKENLSLNGGFLLKGKNYETVINSDSIKEFVKERYEGKIIKELFAE